MLLIEMTSNADLRAVIDHLQRQNDEQKELLQMFSDSAYHPLDAIINCSDERV